MKNNFLKVWCISSTVIVLSFVFYIIGYIFIKGIKVISFDFIFNSPKGMPLGMEGGILPAILGSIYLTIIGCMVSSLLGISTAIYLHYYAENEKILTSMRLIIQCIAGVPSIVLGLFGYTFFVMHLKIGISLLSAGMTLGIMIFPSIEIRVEKILSEISKDLIYSSYALGTSKSYTLFKLILPMCKRNIFSTMALGGGFAIGAAAPIILTGAVMYAPVPKSLFSPVMALPYHLYILIGEGISTDKAYGTALILIFIVIFIHMILGMMSRIKKED